MVCNRSGAVIVMGGPVGPWLFPPLSAKVTSAPGRANRGGRGPLCSQCLSFLQPAALVMVFMQNRHKSWQVPRLAIPLPSTLALLLLDSCSQHSLLYFGTPAHWQLPATVANVTFICCQRKLSARSSDQPPACSFPALGGLSK